MADKFLIFNVKNKNLIYGYEIFSKKNYEQFLTCEELSLIIVLNIQPIIQNERINFWFKKLFPNNKTAKKNKIFV